MVNTRAMSQMDCVEGAFLNSWAVSVLAVLGYHYLGDRGTCGAPVLGAVGASVTQRQC